MKRVFFIDYENVAYKGLEKIEKLNIQDTVIIYFNKYYYDEKLAESIKANVKKFAGKVESYNLYSPDKNAMDFLLCSHLGYMAGKYEAGQRFYIVSNDKGYRSSIAHIKKLVPGIEIEQISSLSDIYRVEQIRENVKVLLADYTNSKKVISTTVEIMEQAKNLADLHNYLSHRLPKDGEKIYNIILPYYFELNPEIKERRDAIDAHMRKKEEAKESIG